MRQRWAGYVARPWWLCTTVGRLRRVAMVVMHGGRRAASRGYGGCARQLTGDGTAASSDNVG